MDELLKKRGRNLSSDLMAEWVDKRDAAWTPRKSEAKWKCASGHRYIMSIYDRERLDGCPQCRRPMQANHSPETPQQKSQMIDSSDVGSIQIWDGKIMEYTKLHVAKTPDLRTCHHIFVLDRSGSMYGCIAGMQDTVIKLVAADELHRKNVVISVISYSSNGDVTVHVRRICAPKFNSSSLVNMFASGLTSISGGLCAALALTEINEANEATIISLHSDGYANDPSPLAERNMCMVLAGQIRARGAILNTIAHHDSSDYAMLAQLANEGGGACVRVGNLRELHDALWRAHAQQPTSPHVVTLTGKIDYILRITDSKRKIVLEHPVSEVRIFGDEEIYQLQETTNVLDKAKSQNNPRIALAFARGMIGIGRPTAAKKVALATNFEALEPHRRAMTASEITAMSGTIENLIFDTNWSAEPPSVIIDSKMGKITGPVLSDVLAALANHRGQIRIHLPTLATDYSRRGLKRIPGTWEGDKIVHPTVHAVSRRSGSDQNGWCDLTSVDQNHQSATINITLSEPIELWRKNGVLDGRVLKTGGISLENLHQYRSFTVVSDGELLVKKVRLEISTLDVWNDLRALIGNPFTGEFTPGDAVDLNLTNFRLVKNEEPPPPSGELISLIMYLTATQRLLSASLPAEVTTPYTSEQIASLRKIHVTPSLYFSPPTCYPYADLKQAQIDGKVDSRTRYNIRFGANGVMVSDLRSANEMIRRMFSMTRPVTDGCEVIENPTILDFFNPNTLVTPKTSKKQVSKPQDTIERDAINTVKLLTDEKLRVAYLRQVERDLETCWATLRDPVMAIGASGCVPDSWGMAHDATWASTHGYKIGKALLDATFYELPDGGVVAVASEVSLYSVSWD